MCDTKGCGGRTITFCNCMPTSQAFRMDDPPACVLDHMNTHGWTRRGDDAFCQACSRAGGDAAA